MRVAGIASTAASVPRGVRRYSAVGVTQRKRAELLELARRFVRARDRYIVQFWDPKFASIVLRGPRFMPEELRRLGWGDTGLSARYSELAAKRAAAVLRSGWSAAFASARMAITHDQRLSAAEKRWHRTILARPVYVAKCLEGGPIDIDEDWAEALDQRSLAVKLRRMLYRFRPNRPHASRRSWLELDGSLYRCFHREDDRHFRGAWLAITGLRPKHRIAIPLAGRDVDVFAGRTASGRPPDVRVSFIGTRIVFDVLTFEEARARTAGLEAGVDKGYRTLLTVSLGDPSSARTHGTAAHNTIAHEAENPPTTKERRRVQAYERSIRASEPARASRMRRCNLGTGKRDRRTARSRARLRGPIGQALNELFADHRIVRLNVERLDFLSGRLTRTANRRLGRWLKGFLQQRLAHKAKLNGVELNVVNAAWTSLTCPYCWFPSKQNRSAERFLCGSCGYTGSADAIAATNILRRGSDLAITRWTSANQVRQILEGRWRAALNGSAWSLRGTEDGAAREAANNCDPPCEDPAHPVAQWIATQAGSIDFAPR